MKEPDDAPACYASPRWKPKYNAHYYLILGNGEIQRFQWNNTPFDYEAWDFGNCFRLRSEAESAREKVKKVLLSFRQSLC